MSSVHRREEPNAARGPDRGWEVSGFVIRARRCGDLSQRELAAAVGVSQSTIAALEVGDRDPSVSLFRSILAAGGLRLAVVDTAGDPVASVSWDTVRDNAGRRLPAHLDADPPDRRPVHRPVLPEKGRLPVKAWYRMRVERDRVRDSRAEVPDHPTRAELAERRRRQLYGPRPPAPGARDVHVECTCETACWLGTTCTRDCVCQCEPAGPAATWPPAPPPVLPPAPPPVWPPAQPPSQDGDGIVDA